MKFSKLKKLFYLLYKNGAKAIVLTGGEPSMRNDFGSILKELKKYKFKIFLDTNGDFFFKYKKLISKSIDVLGLPIDFSDSRSYRNRNNFKTITKILDYYKKLKKRPIIRIGTVVTQDNFKDLNKIGKILKNYPVDIWKIYEFTPQNINAIRNKSLLEIPSKKFNEITKKAKKDFSMFFKVIISKRNHRNHAYFFINSDGKVFMPIDDFNICREKKIGDIFNKDILKKWKKLISDKNYIKNAKQTFNFKL